MGVGGGGPSFDSRRIIIFSNTTTSDLPVSLLSFATFSHEEENFKSDFGQNISEKSLLR